MELNDDVRKLLLHWQSLRQRHRDLTLVYRQAQTESTEPQTLSDIQRLREDLEAEAQLVRQKLLELTGEPPQDFNSAPGELA